MKRWALLFTLITVSLWAVAQTSGGSAGGSTAGGARTGGAATSGAGAASGAAQTPTNGTTAGTPMATNGATGGVQPISGTFNGGNTGFNTMPANNGQVSNGASSGATSTSNGVVSGLNTATGTAFVSGSSLPPLLTPPEVHLSTVAPSAGATNATPGNVAGAVNSTLTMPQPPRIVTTVPEISSSSANVFMTPAPQQVPGASPLSYTAPGPGPTGPYNTGVGVSISGGVMTSYLDRGVGSGTATVAGSAGGTPLGDMARENRQHNAAQNAHTYTNADIQRINQQPAVTVGGMTGAAIGNGGATAQPANNPPAVSQPAGSTPSSNPGVSTPVPPANNPPETSSMTPSPSRNQPVQMAQANPPANPAQETQSAQPARRGRQLPRSGSVLPLVALVGFAATAAGLMAR